MAGQRLTFAISIQVLNLVHTNYASGFGDADNEGSDIDLVRNRTTTTESYPTVPPPPAIAVILGAIIPLLIALGCIACLACRMNRLISERLTRSGSGSSFPFAFGRHSSPTLSRREIIRNEPPEYTPRECIPNSLYEEPPPPYDSLVFESGPSAAAVEETKNEIPSV